MFEQAELRRIPMGPCGPPNAKGAAQIAPEIAILENQAIWVILIILGKTCHFGHFGHPFPRQDGPPEKKSQLGRGLDARDRARRSVSLTQASAFKRKKPCWRVVLLSY